MSPSKLPRMALSHHSRFSPSEHHVRCPYPPGPQKGLESPQGARIRAFWRQLVSTFRYIRLKREGARLMGEYVRVSEALGWPLHLQPQTPEQQQRLQRVREIQQELTALRYGRRMAQGEA